MSTEPTRVNDDDGGALAGLPLDDLLRKRRSLRRRLATRDGLQPIRIAVLGGSTTNELVDLLELWLLASGFLPTFHQSEYNRWYADAVHDSAALEAFRPDLVYVHTTVRNVQSFPPVHTTEAELAQYVTVEVQRFREVWQALERKLGCLVLQNNFELPQESLLDNLDAMLPGGRSRFVAELNREFALAAAASPRLVLQDLAGIAARLGLDHWFDPERWFSYKLAMTPEGSNALAQSLAALIRGAWGRARKVLVLDLDNTLWGGVIGDDGPDRIAIGRETPIAEAYTAFQEYCLALRERGVLLAVCSKNDEAVARQGFSHPDSVLRLEHFASFRANWLPKHENILAIARELNLGADSFVFVDDNPAERAIVAAQIPGIAVPKVGSDVAAYARILECGRYFEQISLSAEDRERSALYQQNSARAVAQAQFADYGEYLDSLEMVAEIGRFKPVYLERIAQLSNKTNQFNLTTRRYSLGEITALASDPAALGLYGRLSDRFGDNGLVSVVLGLRQGRTLLLELWLMSCRVLKRDMELAMLDVLVEHARTAGYEELRGIYRPSAKNGMVAGHYAALGFACLGEESDGSTLYSLRIADYSPRSQHIRVLEKVDDR